MSIFETNISYVTIGGRKVATSKISFVIVLFYYWDVFKNLDFVSAIQRDRDFGYGLINWIIAKFTNDYWAFSVYCFCFNIFNYWSMDI